MDVSNKRTPILATYSREYLSTLSLKEREQLRVYSILCRKRAPARVAAEASARAIQRDMTVQRWERGNNNSKCSKVVYLSDLLVLGGDDSKGVGCAAVPTEGGRKGKSIVKRDVNNNINNNNTPTSPEDYDMCSITTTNNNNNNNNNIQGDKVGKRSYAEVSMGIYNNNNTNNSNPYSAGEYIGKHTYTPDTVLLSMAEGTDTSSSSSALPGGVCVSYTSALPSLPSNNNNNNNGGSVEQPAEPKSSTCIKTSSKHHTVKGNNRGTCIPSIRVVKDEEFRVRSGHFNNNNNAANREGALNAKSGGMSHSSSGQYSAGAPVGTAKGERINITATKTQNEEVEITQDEKLLESLYPETTIANNSINKQNTINNNINNNNSNNIGKGKRRKKGPTKLKRGIVRHRIALMDTLRDIILSKGQGYQQPQSSSPSAPSAGQYNNNNNIYNIFTDIPIRLLWGDDVGGEGEQERDLQDSNICNNHSVKGIATHVSNIPNDADNKWETATVLPLCPFAVPLDSDIYHAAHVSSTTSSSSSSSCSSSGSESGSSSEWSSSGSGTSSSSSSSSSSSGSVGVTPRNGGHQKALSADVIDTGRVDVLNGSGDKGAGNNNDNINNKVPLNNVKRKKMDHRDRRRTNKDLKQSIEKVCKAFLANSMVTLTEGHTLTSSTPEAVDDTSTQCDDTPIINNNNNNNNSKHMDPHLPIRDPSVPPAIPIHVSTVLNLTTLLSLAHTLEKEIMAAKAEQKTLLMAYRNDRVAEREQRANRKNAARKRGNNILVLGGGGVPDTLIKVLPVGITGDKHEGEAEEERKTIDHCHLDIGMADVVTDSDEYYTEVEIRRGRKVVSLSTQLKMVLGMAGRELRTITQCAQQHHLCIPQSNSNTLNHTNNNIMGDAQLYHTPIDGIGSHIPKYSTLASYASHLAAEARQQVYEDRMAKHARRGLPRDKPTHDSLCRHDNNGIIRSNSTGLLEADSGDFSGNGKCITNDKKNNINNCQLEGAPRVSDGITSSSVEWETGAKYMKTHDNNKHTIALANTKGDSTVRDDRAGDDVTSNIIMETLAFPSDTVHSSTSVHIKGLQTIPLAHMHNTQRRLFPMPSRFGVGGHLLPVDWRTPKRHPKLIVPCASPDDCNNNNNIAVRKIGGVSDGVCDEQDFYPITTPADQHHKSDTVVPDGSIKDTSTIINIGSSMSLEAVRKWLQSLPVSPPDIIEESVVKRILMNLKDVTPTINTPDDFQWDSTSPTPTTVQPDSPTPTTVQPHSPTPTTVQPDSPTPTTVQPHSPTPTSVQPHSPTPTTVQPHSPTPTSVQPALRSNRRVPTKNINNTFVRQYVTNILTDRLDDLSFSLIKKLREAQKKLKEHQPLMYKARMHYVVGMREAMVGISSGRVKMVMLAPEVEEVEGVGRVDLEALMELAVSGDKSRSDSTSGDGGDDASHQEKEKAALKLLSLSSHKLGLEGSVRTIIAACAIKRIPVIYCMSRQRFGFALNIFKVKVSIFAMMSANGAYDELRDLMAEAGRCREAFNRLSQGYMEWKPQGSV